MEHRVEFDFEIAFTNGGGLTGTGFRLDIPAGATERWSPGETRTVRLVRFAGEGGRNASGEPG